MKGHESRVTSYQEHVGRCRNQFDRCGVEIKNYKVAKALAHAQDQRGNKSLIGLLHGAGMAGPTDDKIRTPRVAPESSHLSIKVVVGLNT